LLKKFSWRENGEKLQILHLFWGEG